MAIAMAAAVCFAAGCARLNADKNAIEACKHVETSLTLYNQAESNPNASQAASQMARAQAELEAALPLAALAASESGRWQALQFTLGESSRVNERQLVHALAQQCQSALSNPNGA